MANITSNKTEISILLVDDDPISLAILKKALQQLKHHVVAMENPIDALCVLRKQEKSFDLVLTDVHMPEMSGLELLNHVEKEFKLPVILMSSDRDKGIMLKGLEDGAAFYFVKPVSEHMLSRIWQFAISCTTTDDDDDDDDDALIVHDQHDMMHVDNDDNNNKNNSNNSSSSSSNNNNNSSDINNNFIRNLLALMIQGNTPFFNPNALKRPNLFAMRIKHNTSLTKKPKLVWTTSLHNLFLEAVNKLGLDNAMPKKILDLMNVPGLKREHVASHLQKYRLFLKRILEVTKSMEDGIAHDWDDRPFRSSFVLNEITYLTKALQQHYRGFLAQSQGEINECNLHEKGQSFTQVNNTFGDFNPNNKANPRNTTAVPGDKIRINPNQNVMEPNQLPGFRACQQEFPRFEQQQIYGNNGKLNNNNNNKPSKSYNYVGLRLDSNGELISPTFNQNNGGKNSHGNAIHGIRGFGEKRSGSQEELIYHHNFAYDFNKTNYSFVNNYNKNNNSFENNYNKNNYSFENDYYNNNNNNAAPVFDDVYLGIDDENNVYIPNEYDQNEEISPQENLFGMSKDVPTTMYGSIGDELRELGIDFQNDQEIFGNGLGFGSFGVQGDAQGSVFQGPDEEITLNDDISFESYFAQEFIEQECNQQQDGIDFNNPN